jgi:hypothetical protein
MTETPINKKKTKESGELRRRAVVGRRGVHTRDSQRYTRDDMIDDRNECAAQDDDERSVLFSHFNVM